MDSTSLSSSGLTKITLKDIDLSLWDQRKSLAPAPFTGPCKRLLPGIKIGDPRIDALPMSKVCSHGGKARDIEHDPEPSWIDWEKIRRGQALWTKHLGRTYLALTVSLLHGFSIARFAVVLHANGYAQDAATAYMRYSTTAFYIMDMLRLPLDDPKGRGKEAIYNVRAMHSFARRRAIEQQLFQNESEGIALSQYDMAEVQLGFSMVAMSIAEIEMRQSRYDRHDAEDMIFCWRYIGYHLGIQDEFNVCNSLDDAESILEEWMRFTPNRLASCRECTFDLQKSAVEGFGMYTGIGPQFWRAMLYRGCRSRNWDIPYLREPEPLFGMEKFADLVLKMFGNDHVNYLVTRFLLTERENVRLYPDFMKRLERFKLMGSKFHDSITWRLAGLFATFYSPVLTPVSFFIIVFLIIRRIHQKYYKASIRYLFN